MLFLNLKESEKLKIPIDVALYIASIFLKKSISNNTFQEACSRGLIEYDGFTLQREPINIRLTPSGNEIFEDIFSSNVNISNSEDQRIIDLAKKMQEVFPTGKKPGTNLMWRDSQSIIAKKLRGLIKKYKVTFTDEEALDAAKKYIESFNGDYHYMQVLKYFISKKDIITGEENSQFLSYLENAGQEDVSDENWTSTLK